MINPIHEENILKCIDLIRKSNNTLVLTGAGMSTESGIPDFRSNTGVYSQINPMDISHQAFYTKPKQFYEFVKKHLVFENVKPNIGHEILAKWEEQGLIQQIITQNIDGLHQAAGSKNVLEIHGTCRTATCVNPKCRKVYDLPELIKQDGEFYYCSCMGDRKSRKSLIKPDMVLFNETVKDYMDAVRMVSKADLFIVLGTSLSVFPVADMPFFLKDDARMIIINYTPTTFDNGSISTVIRKGIGETLKEIDILLGTSD